MSEETIVTRMIGGVTGGTFQVALATADADGEIISVLGSVDVVGDGAEQEVALATSITLMPGTRYALGSGRVGGSGSFYEMANIDRTAIEAHPRIESGTWMPVASNAYEWGGGAGGFGGTAWTTSTMPRIGFRYQE